MKLKNAKLRTIFGVLLSVIFALSLALAIAFTFSKNEQTFAETQDVITGGINSAVPYSAEKEIKIQGDTTVSASLEVGAAKTVRITSDTGAKLTLSGGLTIKPEANLILDVETEFTGGTVTVEGTLTVNHRLYNKVAVTVKNQVDPTAELPSKGVIIGGSLNNDAEAGGNISIASGATLTTLASTNYTVKTENGTSTQSNYDGGALLLRASSTALGLTVVSPKTGIINDGSIIYDITKTLPAVSGSGVAVGATFQSASGGVPTAAGTYVLYGDSGSSAAKEYSVGNSVTLSNAVNLLSFGKITYKLSANNRNFQIGQYRLFSEQSGNVSLGGGTSEGKEFTQGANELIFDGGANWQKGARVNYTEGSDLANNSPIFYDEDNVPHIYTRQGNYNSSNAYFYIYSGSLSVYSGAKITNYARTGGAGGAVNVRSGQEIKLCGGEISQNAVMGQGEDPVGAGIYTEGGTINIYAGKVTRNAASTTGDGSADGAGVVARGGTLRLYSGEISYNHSALGTSSAPNADGGGLMLHSDATGYVYGGSILGNFAGGSGGGVFAWNSTFNIYGGDISKNRAAYGGGIGVTSNSSTLINVYGGNISDNEAFRTFGGSAVGTTPWGGYGGGVCVGAEKYPKNSSITVSGDAVISGNKAFYGGGLAVYTHDSDGCQLTMSDGLITGNGAYVPTNTNSYCADYINADNARGGGVYVINSESGANPMLLLSGDASIDSSNTVSFNIANLGSSTVAPIDVANIGLTGNGLGALVNLGDNTAQWAGKAVISNASAYIDRFAIDSKNYLLTANSGTKSISVSASTDANSNIAQVLNKDGTVLSSHTSLADAIKAAEQVNGNDTVVIEILKTATISEGTLNINRNITIQPASGKDVTLVVSSETNFGANNALFNVAAGATLTFNGDNGANSGLTIDGNGNGRRLKMGESSAISLVVVNGGTNSSGQSIAGKYVQTGNVNLRNNLTSRQGSAVEVRNNAVFQMDGGVIEANVSEYENGSAVYLSDTAQFIWNGGTIQNNVSSNNALADYGIYLSSANQLQLGRVTLAGDVIYLSASAEIVVNTTFNADENSKFKLVLPSASSLSAGNAVIHLVGRSENDAKIIGKQFEIVNEQNGLSLGIVGGSGAYSHNIIVYKTTTFLLDAEGYEKMGNMEELIDYLTAGGASSVKTRDNGKVLVVEVLYGRDLGASLLTRISDFYTKTGHTIMSWEGDLSYSYNASLQYLESRSSTPVALTAQWQINEYRVTFNTNAPQAGGLSAAVNGTAPASATYKYTEANNKNIASDVWITGFAFAGWEKNVATEQGVTTKLVFENDTMSVADFDATETRALFSVSVNARWISIFSDGIGSAASPFKISDDEHLENLRKSVAGEEVIVTDTDGREITYRNSEGSNAVVPASYSSYYFVLGKDFSLSSAFGTIGSQSAPFSGSFNGQLNTVTLDGTGLFGYLQNATLSNIVFKGSVTGGDIAGAAAYEAHNTRISGIANEANVTADSFAGGIVGKMNGGAISNSYNHGAVTANNGVAGGIVANDDSANISSVYNTGAITANGGVAGGIVGEIVNTSVEYSFNGGLVAGATKGAVAGGITGVAFISVYYNTDRTADLKGVGDGTDGTNGAITPLTSSKMYVASDGASPAGMTLIGSWSYVSGGDEICYYPQISLFGGASASADLKQLSKDSVKLIVPDPDTGDDTEITTELEFTVTFYYNRGIEDEVYTTQSVKFGAGAFVIKPEDPVNVGYVFDGNWYLDKDCKEVYDFNSGVSAVNINLYAKWTAQEYRFTYELGGGTELTGEYTGSVNLDLQEILPLAVGENADNEESGEYNTRRDGYYFLYWTYDGARVDSVKLIREGTEVYLLLYNNEIDAQNAFDRVKFTAETNPVSAVRFTAVWEPRNYTITYHYILNDGTELVGLEVTNPNAESYKVTDIVMFQPAVAKGYTYEYWTTDENGSADGKITHLQRAFGDKDIYGVFSPNTYTISFYAGEGTLLAGDATLETGDGLPSVKVAYNSQIPSALKTVRAKSSGQCGSQHPNHRVTGTGHIKHFLCLGR